MRKLLLASFAVALVVVMTSAQANHSWANYHWARTSNPFNVRIVDSVVGPWNSLLQSVSSDWGAASVFNTSVGNGKDRQIARLACRPIDRKIHVCNANYGPNLWFGQATVYLSNGHITRAITQLNDFYFTGTYGNNVARRHVLCQEIGHDFGLDHVHGTGSCMDDDNGTLNNTSYQRPNSHDYAQLSTIYSHLDGFNSSTASASASLLQPDRVQIIGGETVLTFIHWVSE